MPATDSYWRDIKRMHVVFAWSGVALFVATIWMMAADHDDEWRSVQATNDRILAELNEREQRKETSDPQFQKKREELEAELAAGNAAIVDHRSEVTEREKEVVQADLKQDLTGRRLREQRAIRDVARANFDLKVRDNASDEVKQEFLEKFNEEQRKAVELEIEYQADTEAFTAARDRLKAKTLERDQAKADLNKLEANVDQLKATYSKLHPTGFSGLKRSLMNWPIIDGFNSPTRVIQDWIHIPIKLGMAETERFDRCRTCHLNIDSIAPGPVPAFPHGESESADYKDWVDAGKYPHPYSTHPRVDLYLTTQSPHPLGKFGCSSCHDGQGSATSFTNASHTPNSPIQEAEWHEEHHYASNHFWEYPMFPKRLQEASCLKCHHGVSELAVNPQYGETAPKLVEGWRLIRKYGCFGCHEINGYDAGKSIGPDIRLEPQTAEEAKKIADDPMQVAGAMRKVGPSLRHIATKTTPGWLEYWTEEPRRFRPSTRMPQFYHLTNQQDADAKKFTPIELAGMSQFLFGKSQPMNTLSPKKGYVPDIERGKLLFSQKGCLACHSHSEFPEGKADFGPNLDRVHDKLPLDKKESPDAVNFSNWLYTWIREPERYHARTKMPNLFLDPTKEGDAEIDPAADIAAWLLVKGSKEYAALSFRVPADAPENVRAEVAERTSALEEYSRLLLSKAIPIEMAKNALEKDERYPVAAAPVIKGDEIELVSVGEVTEVVSPGVYKVAFAVEPKFGEKADLNLAWTSGEWLGRKSKVSQYSADTGVMTLPLSDAAQSAAKQPAVGDKFYLDGQITQEMKLNYVGRKTVSKYGCYGCHDIPEFEAARPIGVALQDWGRKDTSRLAPEHIHEFLHHHGEPDGSSTQERVESSLKQIRSGELTDPADKEKALSAAYFYESLMHHGRAGFFWQKLRQPRSYDYEKIETKGFDERLKMPKFPFTEPEIEAIATFVLGLVAEPPSSAYVYQPDARAAARQKGEILLDKYNCTGCHSVELPKFTVRTEIEGLRYFKGLDEDQHPQSLDLLLNLKPPREVTAATDENGVGVLTFEGAVALSPDKEEDPEDQVYNFRIWENLKVNGKLLQPMSGLEVPVKDVLRVQPAHGGEFAHLLIDALVGESRSLEQIDGAWQKAPPTLYKEGIKVQTPWLYRFLKEPYQLRHTTVLRMPKFNMSDEEARGLANYFAAVDGAEFPYQDVPQRDATYLAGRNDKFHGEGDDSYLGQSWRVLNNGKLCINCHSVGGRDVQVDPMKPLPRGPNLDHASDRLRPDWTMLWIYNPKWVTPYTAMPALFSKTKPPVADLLDGNGQDQAVGVRDALMNYGRLLERFGKVTAAPSAPANDEKKPEKDTPNAKKEEET